MKQKFSNCYVALLLCTIFFACNEKHIEIEGVVLMHGNEPFTKLVIRSAEKYFEFSPQDKKKYSLLQGKRVKFWGTVNEFEMLAADESFSRTVYKLKTDSLKVLDNL